MKNIKTIRGCFFDLSIKAFVAVIVVMFTSFILYSLKKAKVAEQSVQSDLVLNLKTQVDMFLPSYLLPEQKQGLDLMVERIVQNEGLEMGLIFNDKSELPSIFPNCTLSDSVPVSCPSADMSMTAVIAPLADNNELYGYFLKAKKNASAASIMGLVQVAGLILLMLGLTFLSIYFYMSHLIAKVIPQELDNLVKWVESEFHGQKNENIDPYFKEIYDLRTRISEVIERYNQSRDQAIIGQVTSGIMHDIKTPMQSIVAAVHLVSEHEANTPKRLRRLENLYTMCASNLPIIGEIIETTLDGNRNIQISKSTSDLRKMIDSSVQVTKEFSRLRNVSVEVDAPNEILVNHDSLQFSRVINNLLKNGIEAASESTLGPAKVKVSVEATGAQVKLTVEDSGPGFNGSPDKVFRAFSTTKSRGTGLGLLISKKIVEAHNGIIKASNGSEFGGAKLEVMLPV